MELHYIANIDSDTCAVLSDCSSNKIQAFKRALLFLIIFMCSYFSLLFFWNALLSLLSPKMFEVTENRNFFSWLASLAQFVKIRST